MMMMMSCARAGKQPHRPGQVTCGPFEAFLGEVQTGGRQVPLSRKRGLRKANVTVNHMGNYSQERTRRQHRGNQGLRCLRVLYLTCCRMYADALVHSYGQYLFKWVHVAKEAVVSRGFLGLVGISERGNANARLD